MRFTAYEQYGTRGMGAIDWGSIIKTGIQTAGNVITRVTGGQTVPNYGTTPTTQTQARTGGVDFQTLALIGIGAFLLVKVMGNRR